MRLFISDKCLGLVEALGEFYPEAAWQRCMVHWYRNVFTVVPKGKVKEVAAMLKAIHAQEDRQAAREKAQAVVEKLEAMQLAKAAAIVRDGVDETLSYMAFPREHWTRHSHEQRAGADHAGDSPADARGGQLPGRHQRLMLVAGPAAAHRRDRRASVTVDSGTLARSSHAWTKATRGSGGPFTGRSAIRAVASAAHSWRENSCDSVEIGCEVGWPAWGQPRGNRFEAGLLRPEKAS